jgi:hypothetical protein
MTEHEVQHSYDVRFWDIRTYEGKKGTTYTIRWLVAGVAHRATYKNRALATSRRNELMSHASRGIAFDIKSGLPVPLLRKAEASRTWYDLACSYVDHKWPDASAKHRASIADAMTMATLGLLRKDRKQPDSTALRKALRSWVFNSPRRGSGAVPDKWAEVIEWVERNTVEAVTLADVRVAERALTAIRHLVSGGTVAPNTERRRCSIFHEALKYGVKHKYLAADPMPELDWKLPKNQTAIDRRQVANPDQARALLAAVRTAHPAGPSLVAFYGCLYHAGMRPGEADGLREADLEFPEQPDGSGTIHLSVSAPAVNSQWTDNGETHDDRGLKHRPPEEVRPVPMVPALARLLREHIAKFGVGKDGRLFRRVNDKPVSESLYETVWKKARETALSPAQAASPLASVPYDLRHACLSTWLKMGVSAQKVSEWAGNSPAVLLRTYAKCLDGEEQESRAMIERAN